MLKLAGDSRFATNADRMTHRDALAVELTETLRRATVETRAAELAALGFDLVGLYDSPVAGAEGNRETFALLVRGGG